MCRQIEGPRRVIARKPHRCDWCGGRIESGDEYRVSTFVGDSIYRWHECDRCKAYVSDMWCWYGSPRMLDAENFATYMQEEHPDVWKEWKDEL